MWIFSFSILPTNLLNIQSFSRLPDEVIRRLSTLSNIPPEKNAERQQSLSNSGQPESVKRSSLSFESYCRQGTRNLILLRRRYSWNNHTNRWKVSPQNRNRQAQDSNQTWPAHYLIFAAGSQAWYFS